MDICCSTSETESLGELLHQVKDSKALSGSDCCKLLKACRSDEDYFTVFAYLPQLLKHSVMKESDASAIASCLPVDFLRRLLLSEGSVDAESYQNLAVDVLSVILSNFPTGSLENCRSLVSSLRNLVVTRKNWATRDLENTSCILLKILPPLVAGDVLNDILNVVASHLKENTKELPSLALLRCLEEALKKVISISETAKQLNKETWPADLRIIITRIFRTREIPKDYRKLCFELAVPAVQLIGAEWFNSEQHFAMLLISLAEVEVHLLLDDPCTIEVDELIVCISLVEIFINLVEEEDFLDDERATQISRTCQQIVAYLCEYLVECSKHKEVTLAPGVDLTLLRLICSFLCIGGARILDKTLLGNTGSLLVDVARRNLTFGDGCPCKMLIEVLDELPCLPKFTLSFMMEYVEAYSGSSQGLDVEEIVSHAILSLKGRNDWYDRNEAMKAVQLATNLNLDDLQRMLKELK